MVVNKYIVARVSMSAAVEVSELVKVFCKVRALDDLSFQIKKGEIYALRPRRFFTKTSTLNYPYTHLENEQ